MPFVLFSFLSKNHCVITDDRVERSGACPHFLLVRFRSCTQRSHEEGVGHHVDSDDDPGPGTSPVWILGVALAHRDVPGFGTPRVSSLALAFADTMGRCGDILAAANSPAAAGVSGQHAERTAVCVAARHLRVAHSFRGARPSEVSASLSRTVSLCRKPGWKGCFPLERKALAFASQRAAVQIPLCSEQKT